MKNQIIIPEKISIHLLCELLSLSGMQEQAKLDALKQYSNENGLLFTFISMTEVKALPINMPIGDEYDENNEFIDHHDAKEESIEWFNCISFTLNQYFLSEGKATTCINWFKVNGKLFHVVNDDNNNVGDLFIDLSNVFVKKSDYGNFIKKATSQMHQVKAPYQDINSEYYSPELDLAIQLHHAIQIEKFGNVNQPRENRVTKWLNENRQDDVHKNAKIERLSTIIGINKKQGDPVTN
jgi:hypothetical protein